MTVFLCVSNESEGEQRSMGEFNPFRVWGEEAIHNFAYMLLFFLLIYSERDKQLIQ